MTIHDIFVHQDTPMQIHTLDSPARELSKSSTHSALQSISEHAIECQCNQCEQISQPCHTLCTSWIGFDFNLWIQFYSAIWLKKSTLNFDKDKSTNPLVKSFAFYFYIRLRHFNSFTWSFHFVQWEIGNVKRKAIRKIYIYRKYSIIQYDLSITTWNHFTNAIFFPHRS